MATRATFLREAVASRTRGLPAAFWTIWCGLVVNRLASFVLPFLSIYLVRDRGFLPAQAGRVLALYGVGVTVAGPLGGFIADRARRGITLVVGVGPGGGVRSQGSEPPTRTAPPLRAPIPARAGSARRDGVPLRGGLRHVPARD